MNTNRYKKTNGKTVAEDNGFVTKSLISIIALMLALVLTLMLALGMAGANLTRIG